jgi:hypothetical protein
MTARVARDGGPIRGPPAPSLGAQGPWGRHGTRRWQYLHCWPRGWGVWGRPHTTWVPRVNDALGNWPAQGARMGLRSHAGASLEGRLQGKGGRAATTPPVPRGEPPGPHADSCSSGPELCLYSCRTPPRTWPRWSARVHVTAPRMTAPPPPRAARRRRSPRPYRYRNGPLLPRMHPGGLNSSRSRRGLPLETTRTAPSPAASTSATAWRAAVEPAPTAFAAWCPSTMARVLGARVRWRAPSSSSAGPRSGGSPRALPPRSLGEAASGLHLRHRVANLVVLLQAAGGRGGRRGAG